MAERQRALLIHGAWHGAWTWDDFVSLLDERGVDATAVDLPSAGSGGDLAADVGVVRAALDGLGPSSQSVTVVAHSYGGVVATEATAGRSDVGHLVYVAAFQFAVGESVVGALQGELPPWIAVDEAAGSLTVTDPVTAFYGDVDPDVAAAAASRLRAQALKSFADPVSSAGWQGRASTYVACTEDQAIPYPAQQAMSERAGAVVTLRSSHSPFYSHADEVADVVEAAAAAGG